ncbi:pilus assembly protein (plasmid) [Streptomyces sp. NBC_00445]|uniref:TadE/TadG family type IV pilus assembly protein n=1 Tax=Streptomyces sp. NBC_00445 TaxID=2975745 RepID=UPI002E20B5A4
MTTAALRRSLARDDGALSLEAMILAPVLIMVLLLIIAFGRVQASGNAVDIAARNAARAASLERSEATARRAGTADARAGLRSQGLSCTAVSVEITTDAFSAPLGTPAATTATVRCTVPLSDIGLPGLPGSKTLTSSFTSSIDSYRQRD